TWAGFVRLAPGLLAEVHPRGLAGVLRVANRLLVTHVRRPGGPAPVVDRVALPDRSPLKDQFVQPDQQGVGPLVETLLRLGEEALERALEITVREERKLGPAALHRLVRTWTIVTESDGSLSS